MITFCIPSKNNLRYLKPCIASIQRNSYYQNEILVFVDQDNDGTIEWLKENNIDYILNPLKECRGIGYAYDTMFLNAKTNLVVAFHADMILGPKADYYLVKHHKPRTVVCATRIEPPIHPEGPEKIVRDFGLWPEDIKYKEFDEFINSQQIINKDKTTKGMFAPWLIDKKDHLGHDPIFLSVYEDADLFRRFILAGYEMIQTWEGMVYHLTCRGGQFAGAETIEDLNKRNPEWLQNNQLSQIEYIRKWGGNFKENGPCEPRPNVKYDVGVNFINCNVEWFAFEPYFSNIQTDINPKGYIIMTQPYSKFNIESKFVRELENDIIFEVNCNQIKLQDFIPIVNHIEEILADAQPNGQYEFGNGNGIKILVNNKTVVNPKINLYDTKN